MLIDDGALFCLNFFGQMSSFQFISSSFSSFHLDFILNVFSDYIEIAGHRLKKIKMPWTAEYFHMDECVLC
jgi:hypothetical protein